MVWAWNVDGTPNKSGLVKYKTNIVLDYGGVRERWDLFILNCRKDEVILGLSWLQAINLEINWKDSRVMITPANYRWTTGEPPEVSEQWYLLQYMLHDEAPHIEDELYNTFKTWMPVQHVKFFNASNCIPEFVIKWTIISMIIAQGATKEKVTLPTAFKEYKDVFSEKAPIRLLPSQPYNHAIKLKDLFVSQQAKAYLLNPIEHQACKEFIEEHLKIGKISPSKFPQAAPFFFVKKNEAGKLWPCQDYQYLNSHTIKNIYPSPSSLTSLTNYEDHWSSPNSMYDRDITMSSSNLKTDGRPPSPPHWGYSNQTSCSLECATHWLPSRHSWAIFSAIISWKAGW